MNLVAFDRSVLSSEELLHAKGGDSFLRFLLQSRPLSAPSLAARCLSRRQTNTMAYPSESEQVDALARPLTLPCGQIVPNRLVKVSK